MLTCKYIGLNSKFEALRTFSHFEIIEMLPFVSTYISGFDVDNWTFEMIFTLIPSFSMMLDIDVTL